MKYENVVKGKFVDRPNRFVANCEIDEEIVKVHVKNTGRCKELLVPGATVWLEDFKDQMGSRKMRYSVIAVEKERAGKEKLLINMDSQAPNKVAKEALENGVVSLAGMSHLTFVKGEKTYGNSRLDFYVEDDLGNKGFMEVKGVTLENGGVARFPDAPTERGIKHVEELIKAKSEGYVAAILFIIQMGEMTEFRPNDNTHPQFGQALRKAKERGVEILAVDCKVDTNKLSVNSKIRVLL